jgi:hypothetical protein
VDDDVAEDHALGRRLEQHAVGPVAGGGVVAVGADQVVLHHRGAAHRVDATPAVVGDEVGAAVGRRPADLVAPAQHLDAIHHVAKRPLPGRVQADEVALHGRTAALEDDARRVAGDDVGLGRRRAADHHVAAPPHQHADRVAVGVKARGVGPEVVALDAHVVRAHLDAGAGRPLDDQAPDRAARPLDVQPRALARLGPVQHDQRLALGARLAGPVDQHALRDRWQGRGEVNGRHAAGRRQGEVDDVAAAALVDLHDRLPQGQDPQRSGGRVGGGVHDVHRRHATAFERLQAGPAAGPLRLARRP